ncbi:MAG: ABC transporter ATP-binding protein [Vicinamibacteria bacterium]|nr:ABC transporter ATP-binding protein [Vicinamibacteria bacterium]
MTALVSAEGVGKQFRIYSRPLDRAIDWLTPAPARRGVAIWAVRGVTLNVRPGFVLGVIGRNGAGKTSLLRMLGGSLLPTEGRCERRGRVLSLQGLNLALTGALTGRQNVEVAASLLRLPTGYAQRHMDQIHEFSGLFEFFDRPVGTYSAGMRVRLACATFAFLDADILLLDEALTGGDRFFAERYSARLESLIAGGVGVVMASHSMDAVKRHCHEVLILERGAVAFQGAPGEAIRRYLGSRP